MKGITSKVIILMLVVCMCFGMTACGNDGLSSDDSAVFLDYGTGMNKDGKYNRNLYGMNTDNDIKGADPGVFYISPEEDPIWGGYYYMYTTSNAETAGAKFTSDYHTENKTKNLVGKCYRSKDLYQWEVCGALDGGYSMIVTEDDWCWSYFWAPEVILNPADGKYYMYFSAASYQDYGVECMSNSENYTDRLYLGVAVSDTPVGPFNLLYDIDKDTGKRVPTINFKTGCGLAYSWAAIDAHPFFDENGDFYLYFKKHYDDHYGKMDGIWGMKMKTMSQPDYSTVSCLTLLERATASSEPGKITEATLGERYEISEGSCNEGPVMTKHNGKYYLTYSIYGYGQVNYSVYQAVSDSPLSGFRKLGAAEGNPVLKGADHGYMNGTGHHSLVKNGDELWIVYHRHNSTFEYALGDGRSICVDRVNFVTNADGLDVMVANGPSKSLQWLPEHISGYENLAESAKVSINTGSGAQYLNDLILPMYSSQDNSFMIAENEDVVITLTWEQPVRVSSVMIYNSKILDNAFSKISDIRFKLEEQPQWASKDYEYAVIRDLKFPDAYYDEETSQYIACSPAVAEFDEIKVTEIQITISSGDRIVEENQMGQKNTCLNLSEIVVLGGAQKNE